MHATMHAQVQEESGGLALFLQRVEPPDGLEGENGPGLDPRLSVALERVRDLDYTREQRLLAGQQVVVKVPPLAARLARLVRTENEAISARFNTADLIRPLLMAPPSTDALFKYQVDGADWLVEGASRILADDMGLGKTVQAISALRELVAGGSVRNCLIVAPKSLVANWAHELLRWAPELAALRVIPEHSTRERVWELVLKRAHVLITNYEQLRNCPSILQEEGASLIVADEVHRVRKAESRISQGIRLVKRQRFWGLSGTPMERDARDLATVLSVAEPGRFSPSDASLSIEYLRDVARPFVLRRDKETVLDDLPPVLESVEMLELTARQAESYSRAARPWMDGDLTANEALVTLNKLMAICSLDPSSGESSKLDRIQEIVEDVAAAGEKIVVFSYLLAPLHALRRRLEVNWRVSFLEGGLGVEERDQAVEAFRMDPEVVALLSSLRVGGEGLTLTEANHVAFINEWWNPSANIQARDRVVRIGQKRTVLVYRFLTANTVEEALARILKRKDAQFQALIGGLASPEGDLSPDMALALSEHMRRELQQPFPVGPPGG